MRKLCHIPIAVMLQISIYIDDLITKIKQLLNKNAQNTIQCIQFEIIITFCIQYKKLHFFFLIFLVLGTSRNLTPIYHIFVSNLSLGTD